MSLKGLRIALVGPLPPPEGGIANQTRQLGELLSEEGAQVTLVQVNVPYRPRWVGGVRGLRALFRLLPYVLRLWRTAGRVDLFHVMANSGWSWHLFAAPAVWVARLRDVPCVVNYRGGEADRFLDRSAASVLRTLRRASALAVPSRFLHEIFGRRGMPAEIVPNIIDLQRFCPRPEPLPERQHLVVARNLEAIYDIATALRAFAFVRRSIPGARMTIAGSGSQEVPLRRLAEELGVAAGVHFCGMIGRDEMAELYRSASVVLNPSRVDNMPNSVLEAMASGAPVVSTDVGGVPFIVRDGATALLVPPGDPAAMAQAAQRILENPQLAARLQAAALADVQQYAWSQVCRRWQQVYASALAAAGIEARPA